MTVLLYSGGCHFCRWVARKIVKRLDPKGEISLIPIRSHWAGKYLGHLPIEERIKHWWVWTPERGLVPGNAGGALLILEALYATKWLGKLLRILRCECALNHVDDWVNAHRPWLSPWVPDGHAPVVLPK